MEMFRDIVPEGKKFFQAAEMTGCTVIQIVYIPSNKSEGLLSEFVVFYRSLLKNDIWDFFSKVKHNTVERGSNQMSAFGVVMKRFLPEVENWLQQYK
jgi:hypothetical protein